MKKRLALQHIVRHLTSFFSLAERLEQEAIGWQMQDLRAYEGASSNQKNSPFQPKSPCHPRRQDERDGKHEQCVYHSKEDIHQYYTSPHSV